MRPTTVDFYALFNSKFMLDVQNWTLISSFLIIYSSIHTTHGIGRVYPTWSLCLVKGGEVSQKSFFTYMDTPYFGVAYLFHSWSISYKKNCIKCARKLTIISCCTPSALDASFGIQPPKMA
jgi:hypothetical protein